MDRYLRLTQDARDTLSQILEVMEVKFMELARVEDILVIRPDLEKDRLQCGVARQDSLPNHGHNEVLYNELEPYFEVLKTSFAPKVVHKFIKEICNEDMYLKDHADMVTQRLMARLMAPDYTPPEFKK